MNEAIEDEKLLQERENTVLTIVAQIKILINLSSNKAEEFVIEGGIEALIVLMDKEKFEHLILGIFLDLTSLTKTIRNFVINEGVYEIIFSYVVIKQIYVETFIHKTTLFMNLEKDYLEGFLQVDGKFEDLVQVYMLVIEESFPLLLSNLIKILTISDLFKQMLEPYVDHVLKVCCEKSKNESNINILHIILEFCEFFKKKKIQPILANIEKNVDQEKIIYKRIERLRK